VQRNRVGVANQARDLLPRRLPDRWRGGDGGLDDGRAERTKLLGVGAARETTHSAVCYSHSIVPGGLLVTSTVTRLISRTSLVIRVEMPSRTS
jgi:hypothetical protein